MDPAIDTLQRLQLAVLWFDFALVVTLAGYCVYEWRGSISEVRGWLGGASLFALALLARLLVSPHTIVHENAHGYEYLHTAFTLEGFYYHGASYYAFFHPLTSVLGDVDAVVFTGNAMLGALSVVLLVPIGYHLSNQRATGWFAAAMYALWPPMLRIGASESMFPLAIFLGLASLWIALEASMRGRLVLYALAGLLLVAAVQVRPVMALWPGVVLAAVTLRHDRGEGWKWTGLVAAAGLFLLASVPWAIFRARVMQDSGVPEMMKLDPVGGLTSLFSSHHLLFNADWIPVWVWILCVAGLLTMSLWDRRMLAVCVLAVVGLGWFSIGPSSSTLPSQLRLQAPMHVFVLLVAGSALATLYDRTPGRGRTLVRVALALALTSSVALRASDIRRLATPQLEYAFLKEAVPALDPACYLVLPPRSMANGVLTTQFPFWLAAGPVVRSDQVGAILADTEARPCMSWYRGTSCYLFTWQEEQQGSVPPAGFRPECAAFEASHDRADLHTRRFENQPYEDYLHVHVSELEIGFYELIDADSTVRGGGVGEEP